MEIDQTKTAVDLNYVSGGIKLSRRFDLQLKYNCLENQERHWSYLAATIL
jgi:hypothetical protein